MGLVTSFPRIGFVRVLALAVALVLCSGWAEAKWASLVMDAETGQVLHSVNADTRNHPASLTKMMTLYMLFEAVDDGRVNMKTRVRMSRRAARQPASKLGLGAGTSITVENAVKALATKSANDVASAVAEHLGGTERNFARMMTAKARRLGMTRTVFRNASGLKHSGQLSTARDMALLARWLMASYPQHYHYFSMKKFRYAGRTYKNHNKLLASYDGADGIKTGYIKKSGFNLVASAKRGNRRLVGVIFGGNSSKHRNRHMKKILDAGFAKLDPSLVPQRRTARRGASKGGGSGTWGIQVGAYRYRNPAMAMAERAVDTVPSLLSEGVIKVSPLRKKNGRVLYRSRILGLEKREAYRACKALERRKIACMELRAKAGSVQVASAR